MISKFPALTTRQLNQAGICKYSHEYSLTPEQLLSLANNAKKAPCNWLKNGLPFEISRRDQS